MKRASDGPQRRSSGHRACLLSNDLSLNPAEDFSFEFVNCPKRTKKSEK